MLSYYGVTSAVVNNNKQQQVTTDSPKRVSTSLRATEELIGTAKKITVVGLDSVWMGRKDVSSHALHSRLAANPVLLQL